MPKTLITDVGEALLNDALGTSAALAITHVAIGDGAGFAYDPEFAQTSLRRELDRRPIDTRSEIGTNQWRTVTNFPAGGQAITVREVGFFDAAGRLIAIWGGSDVAPRYTGAVDFVLEQMVVFDRVSSGLITIMAPDDELFEHALVELAGSADETTRRLLGLPATPTDPMVTISQLQAQLQQMAAWISNNFRRIAT